MECQNNVRLNVTNDTDAEAESDNKAEVPTVSGSIEQREKECESNSKNVFPSPEVNK